MSEKSETLPSTKRNEVPLEQAVTTFKSSMHSLRLEQKRKLDDEDTEWDGSKRLRAGHHEAAHLEQAVTTFKSSMHSLRLEQKRKLDDEDTEWDGSKRLRAGHHEAAHLEQAVAAIESSIHSLSLGQKRKLDDEDTEWDGSKRLRAGHHEVPLDNLSAPNVEFTCNSRTRADMLRQRLMQEGITQIPNYRIFGQYLAKHSSRTLSEVVEYTKNRMWLEKYTRYKEICQQQWRQHGFRSKVVSRSPYITSAEARALQLWVEDIKADFVYFINATRDPPPEKYRALINGFCTRYNQCKILIS